MFIKPARAYLRRLANLPRRALRHMAGHGKALLLGLAILSGVLAGGGFLVVWAGLVPISASSGHWPVTRWFLHFAMRNAVETQSLGIKAPALNDPALVLKGAGHYATGCVICHGAPGQSQSLIVQQMTPKPPFLPPRIHEWTPEQLFWIVKHGVKFTAMPAWVSLQREDEIWAMVAFLRELPTLSPEHYERLAYGERADAGVAEEATPDYLRVLSDPLGSTLANCARCHGSDGLGRGTGAFPKLAGQSEAYLQASLSAYAKGERNSGIMQPIAAGLNETTIQALAEHYAGQHAITGRPSRENRASAGGPAAADIDPAAIARGRAIAQRGVPEQGVPSCIDCHGPRSGQDNPYYPELAGQYVGYLTLQLSLFKSEKRGGTPYAHIMHSAAKGLNKEQMRDLALYYATLEQGLGNPARIAPSD